MHAGGPPEELAHYLERLRELRKEAGRDHLPFEIFAGSRDAFTIDGVRRLEDQGITSVAIGFSMPYQKGPDPQPLEQKLGDLRRFAEDVIAKL